MFSHTVVYVENTSLTCVILLPLSDVYVCCVTAQTYIDPKRRNVISNNLFCIKFSVYGDGLF